MTLFMEREEGVGSDLWRHLDTSALIGCRVLLVFSFRLIRLYSYHRLCSIFNGISMVLCQLDSFHSAGGQCERCVLPIPCVRFCWPNRPCITNSKCGDLAYIYIYIYVTFRRSLKMFLKVPNVVAIKIIWRKVHIIKKNWVRRQTNITLCSIH